MVLFFSLVFSVASLLEIFLPTPLNGINYYGSKIVKIVTLKCC